MTHSSIWLLTIFITASIAASAGGDIRDPAGMYHFVTRPELIAPQLMVAKHHPEAISPGYYFVTPYFVTNQRQRADTKEYIPCQTGAHIYDADGELIWSGACQYDNRNIFAFQPVDINGTQHLSFWLGHQFVGDTAKIPTEDIPSSAVLLDNTFTEVRRVFQHPFLDCHEVSFQPDGHSILLTRLWKEKKNLKPYGKTNSEVLHGGFRELDLSNETPIFDWDPVKAGVTIDESCDKSGKGSDVGDAWDYFHINSIDKNADGDFLISARHTSTIYKISGKDGSIIWRLGGCNNMSSFEMEEDLPFYWQHHARLLFENSTHAVVSVFDNAGDDFGRNKAIPNRVSMGKIMLLDTVAMTAKMLRRFDRPDGQRSPMGGSVFLQGDNPWEDNVLVNWVIPGYFSEYDKDNRVVFEARFGLDGIKTYRAFKAPFVGHPSEPIAFKTMALGSSLDQLSTSFFVSWNGATEVAKWAFYGCDQPDGQFAHLQTVKKVGFETSWVMPGAVRFAKAVAIDRNGQELGSSEVFSLEPAARTIGLTDYRVRIPLIDDVKALHGEPALTFSIANAADLKEAEAALDMQDYGGDIAPVDSMTAPYSKQPEIGTEIVEPWINSPTPDAPTVREKILGGMSAYTLSKYLIEVLAIIGVYNVIRWLSPRRQSRSWKQMTPRFMEEQ